MDSPLAGAIVIVILIVLNGIFSCGEFAIVSSRKSRVKEMVKEQKEKNAGKLLQMKENPERFLSAVQIGITLFGTLASAIGGALSLKYIVPVAGRIPIIKAFAETASLIFVVVLLTYLFLLFGELVPKYIGLNYKERVALRIAPLFEFTARVFFVFVNFLTFTTMFIVKGLNLKRGEEHVGEGEIKILLEEGRRKGVFDKTEEELIHGVFEFADTSVKEVMVPKPSIYAINIEDSKDDIISYMVVNEFSRYPVYRDYIDNIVGIVYHKDLTRQIWLNEPFDLESILNKPYFVTDTMKISSLLKEMQKRRQHMAVVVDEFGAVAGLVTLEDIMEEIFGEIMDETDVDDRMQRLTDGSVLIDAALSIRDLNNRLNLDLVESPDYETLGGFILAELQGIAKGGEIIHQGPYKFTVVGIDGRRITKVKLERRKKQRLP
jgi:putative hemolysin